MGYRFARSSAAVMATATATGDCRMINVGVRPVTGDVTVVTAVQR